MQLTNKIAQGLHFEVYKQEEPDIGSIAVKVFDKDYKKADVLNEALIHARIEETGLPIPKLVEVSKIDGKWTIQRQFIEGKTYSDFMKENPENIPIYIERMVDLQLAIHSKTSPFLNKCKDRLNQQIESVEEIDATKKYDMQTRLDSMPKHKKLCHGNFCPANILVTEDNHTYLIGWEEATQGNASADVAKTYLLLSLEAKEYAESYIDIFCKKTGTSSKYVHEWLPIVAAAQLSKHIPAEYEFLLHWIDVVDYE